MNPTITLPQSTAIILLIIIILIPTALLGDRYAVRVKLKPIERTWLEVVIGILGSEFFILLMSEGIFWILDILHLVWWVPVLCPGLVYSIAGGCQIIRQEQKLRRDKREAQKIKTIDDIKLRGL